MWPFTPKTLYDRYSKLIKLIMSIDSHFEVTENKENSVRLHLPSYKGNQPMDFHIYLMEPFLNISFVTEIEGEKISTVQSYPQDMDQQDMFNAAMSNNMNRIHQVLEKKYKEELEDEKLTVETNYSSGTSQESQSNGIPIEFLVEDLKENFDYNASFKRHALTFMILRPNSEFWYYSKPDVEKPLWIYNDKKDDKDRGVYMMEESYAIGIYPLLWYYKKYEDKESLCWLFDFLDRHNIDLWAQDYLEEAVDDNHPEELIRKMKRYVPSLKIGNDSQKIKENLSWSWIDIQSLLLFINYCMNSFDWSAMPNESINSLQDCSTLRDLAYLILKDFGVGHNLSSMKKDAVIKEDGKRKTENESRLSEELEAKKVALSKPSVVDKNLIGIKETWPLIEFAREHGKMQVGDFVNKVTGEKFKSCIFTKPDGTRSFVAFSLKLGELTPQQIADMKDELQVVQLESGNYSLCKIGTGTWEDARFKTKEYNSKFSTDRTSESTIIAPGVSIKLLKDDFCKIDSLRPIWVGKIKDEEKYEDTKKGKHGGEEFACKSSSSITESKRPKLFIEAYLTQNKIVNTTKLFPKSPDGKFAIMDVIIHDSNWKVTKSYHNIKEWQEYNISDISTIEYEVETDVVKLVFRNILKEGYDSIWFNQQYGKICMTFYNQRNYIGCFDSEFDKAYTTIENIFEALCALVELKRKNAIITLAGNAFQVNSIQNYYDERMMRDFLPLAIDEKLAKKINQIISTRHIRTACNKPNENLRIRNTWTDEYGAKYTKDKTVLLKVPYDIKEYSIAMGTTSIFSKAFNGCTEIESVNIPSSIKKIECETFSGCTALQQIIIPNNVVYIGDGAFSKCTSLSSISFPNSVEHIGGGVFFGCKGLTAIHIPANVKEIGEDVLCECKNLTSIVVDEKNNYYDSRNKCNAIIESNSNTLIAGCSSTAIPNGVVKIAHQAFGGSIIKSIVIPDGVLEIGPLAFCACEELQSVEIPESVEAIGQLAFCGCKSLTTITIPDGIKEIGDYVFMSCENLKTVSMSDCVETIGKDIFYGCKSLTQIYVNKGGKEKIERFLPDYKDIIVEQIATPEAISEIEDDWWTDENGIPYIIDVMPNSSNSIGEKICNSFTSETDNADLEKKSEEGIANTFIDKFGVEYSSDKKVLKKVPKEITDYSILEGTEIIGDAAFSNCEDLVSVSIPNSIYEIGHYAFAGCKKIFSFIIPRGVKAIGDGAFMNCETLKSLRLSEGLVTISDDAFNGCNNLNSIFVPVEEKIRFEVLLSKFDVNIAEYNSNNVSALDELLSGLLDASGVLYSKDGKVVFTHTKKLSRYSIKEGTEFINDKAFSPIDGVDDDFLSLKEILLPDTIVTIGELAFANNEGLIEISLPASIKSIGKDAFLGCKSLSLVRIPHGTRAKFEKLLPGLAEKLHEKYEDTIDQLTDFELPDGSIYNGSCIRKPFGNVELNGIGSISYTNGDKYKGNFKYGRPYGWGIYWFKNGKHSHKGYFDDLPKGIGYLNENYDMTIGNFFEGRLHGWAICYRNRIFKFGYWEHGKLIKDESENTLWIRKQISHERTYYHGNLIQIGNKHEFIRFGIPSKLLGERVPNIPIEKMPQMPAWGFEFFKDGSVKVGAIRNHDSGEFTFYYPDGTSELGKWKDGVKTSSFTIDWLQKPVDEYKVDGLDVF